MRRLQKKTRNLAGSAREGSGEKPPPNAQGQRKWQVLTQEPQQVIEKTQLRPSTGEAALDSRRSVERTQPPLEEDATRAFTAREEKSVSGS